MALFFFFDPYNLPYFLFTKLECGENKIEGFSPRNFTFSSLQGSAYMKVMNSFLLAEMHYN
jgi:hypothetical protein